jgi:hypothetical protein
MGRGSSCGLIKAHTMGSLLTTTSKEWAFTNGQMVGFTMESGSITKCKAMEHSPGLMEGNMWENTTTT